MGEKITVYEKPTCSKCREVDKILRDSGVDYEKINYYVKPIGEKKLRDLLAKMKLGPRDVLRKTEPAYKELDIASGTHTDDQLIALMAKHPELMQRPIVERGNQAVLGRPVSNVEELLGRKNG